MKSEWREYLLGDLYNFSSGLSKNSKEFGFGKPFLSFKTVFNNYILPEELPDLVNSNVDEQERCSIMKGDIFLTRTSETLNELGMSSVALRDYPEATFNGFTKRLRPKGKQIYPLYVAYYMRSPFFRANINSMASMTTRASLNNDILSRLPIQVPTYGEQEKIGDILYSFDKKIKLNHRINENLFQQASVFFEKAICQSNSLSNIELGSLAEVKGGKRLPKGVNLITVPNQHPYIRVRDLNNAVFASLTKDYEYVDNETQKTISRYIVSTGDVLISIVGTIGLTTIVDDTLDKANLTENCVKLTNLKMVTPEYLLLFLRSTQGVEAMLKGTVGAVQLKLPIKNIQSISVPVLCDEELQPLNEILSAIFSQISANVVEIKKLGELRDTLLPRLISGELDVSAIQL
jgi:type I restriction enzyme S subunit